MSKKCPLYGIAIYMDCLECEDKPCSRSTLRKGETNMKYKKIVIGIDQSYKNTGVSICADGELKKITSWFLKDYKNNSERREVLRKKLDNLLSNIVNKAEEVVIIIERIRLQSQGFLNMDYIKSIGALNSIVVDSAFKYNIKVFSVDTRSWKSQVVGTSKPKENNIGINPEKWPTIQFICKKGFESSIIYKTSKAKKKGVFLINGEKYTYNDDAADSACIALYGFIDKEKQKLNPER